MKNNSGFKNRYHTFFDRVLMKIVISLLFLLLCIVFISISSMHWDKVHGLSGYG